VSSLLRAREEYEDLVTGAQSGHRPSKLVSQGQRAAEYFFRAILYAKGVPIEKTHELQEVAGKHRGMLTDIWPDLEPLLEEYGWLYPQRIIIDYHHQDVPQSEAHPGVAEPEVSRADLDRALNGARRFRELAERVVDYRGAK
jgi:HEPN domain-containing protein